MITSEEVIRQAAGEALREPSDEPGSRPAGADDDRRWTITVPMPDDAVELGRVHAEVWQDAYAEILPPKVLGTMNAHRLAGVWSRDLAAAAAEFPMMTLIARDRIDRAIIGFVRAGPSRDENPPTPWELRAINLLERARGTGLADELVRRVVGDRPTSLWVFEKNRRARTFYQRHGFTPDGASKVRSGSAVEVRMVCG